MKDLGKKDQSIFSKNEAEIQFWENEILNYVLWYRGDKRIHYGVEMPESHEKLVLSWESHSAILTWAKLHQEKKYLADLSLSKDTFKGMKVLDIGSGPIPSGLVFEGCELYCLDPLFPEYIKAGFPLHYYDRVRFVSSSGEYMPFEDDFFDAVISVNAIDHVNDFFAVAGEIKRVLRQGGKLRIHAHYHLPTTTEPLELNDEMFLNAYSWCERFKKVSQSTKKFGSIANEGEYYVLWSNFE